MERVAKYELLSKIASGGMAEIWVARTRTGTGEDLRDLRERVPCDSHGLCDLRERVPCDSHGLCVIKKLLPQHADNVDYKRMFLEEGRLGAALVHPNIVRMFDFGSDGGTHYLAMEYLHGEDLRVANRVNRTEGRTMPLAQAVDIIARACAGLHHAHELRGEDGTPLELVHRDVSPHNVFLTFDGGVKVVDFGIAKSLDRRWETKHGTLKGKVPYMSPEQIKARRLDRRTDIYAMGVMLYELVLGRRPYVLSAGGDFAMMMAIARHDIRHAPQLRGHHRLCLPRRDASSGRGPRVRHGRKRVWPRAGPVPRRRGPRRIDDQWHRNPREQGADPPPSCLIASGRGGSRLE